MKTSSAKNKGRRLQQWFRDLIIKTFSLSENDVRSTSMGAGGADIQLSDRARLLFPYSVECKNVEKLNLYDAWHQCETNAKDDGLFPLLVIKKNNESVLVVLDAEIFMKEIPEIETNLRTLQ